MQRADAMFAEEAGRLWRQPASPIAMPPLGIMVEVPSVALAPELFSDAAFFSIGSNDLTQYVMAAARDNASVAALNAVTQPGGAAADRRRRQLRHGDRGIPVSLCGDAGGDPAAIPHLLAAGLRDLSVAPAQLARGQGGHRRGHGSDDGQEADTISRARRMPTTRSAPTRACCRPSSTSARPAPASALPTRSASTAASSPRSPARPIRRRSRRSICRRSFRSAISARQERDAFLAAYRRAHPGKALDATARCAARGISR